MGQPNQKKVHPSYIFLHLSANLGLKTQNTHCYSCQLTFSTSDQSALNGPPNGPMVIWVKQSTLGSTYGQILDGQPQ